MQLQEEIPLPTFLSDRFEPVKPLGSGGYSEVYLVADKQNGLKHYALKVLKPSRIENKNLERFEEEFKILEKLNSEYLPKAYELIKTDDYYAILMEWVEGQSLLDLINLKKLSFTEIEKIFNDVLEALQELHDHGIAHRDIKLENILVNPNGHAKVTDLGFLKRTSGFEKEDIDNLLGTIQYLAPEYIKHGHYDYRSDLYAVALMLFECLSGRRWLAGKSPEQSLNYLYEINFEFPKLALSGMSVKFTQVLERGLANQPWKRFDSARSMRLAILSENGSEKPFKSVNVKESVNIQDVSARRKTQEFLSLKKKRNDRLILIALVFFVFAVATACIYSLARSMISAESAANTEAAFSDTVEIHPNHIDLNQVEDLNETNELEGYQLKD